MHHRNCEIGRADPNQLRDRALTPVVSNGSYRYYRVTSPARRLRLADHTGTKGIS